MHRRMSRRIIRLEETADRYAGQLFVVGLVAATVLFQHVN